MTRRVGLVGLGLVGMAIGRRLLGAGFAVTGVDIDAAKGVALQGVGGATVDTLGELAGQGVVVVAVFDTAQVEEVVDALLPLGPCVVISVSTCDPDRMAALAERVQRDGISLVEMPISGTSAQIAAGEGVGLVAGGAAAVAGVEDVLAAICPRRHRLARVGDGARAKLAVNLVLGLNRAALAEGMVFAECLGLDPAAFLGLAQGSAAYSQVMDTKGAKMAARDFATQGRVVQSAKDFALMQELAARCGQMLPLAAAYSGLLAGCIEAGEGEWDNAAVIEQIRRLGRCGARLG